MKQMKVRKSKSWSHKLNEHNNFFALRQFVVAKFYVNFLFVVAILKMFGHLVLKFERFGIWLS